MIRTINQTSRFRKEYRKAMRRGYDPALFEFVLNKIINEHQLPEKYRDHALTGKYSGFRECHIQQDWLLIYLIGKDVLTLTLIRTDTHPDLFGT